MAMTTTFSVRRKTYLCLVFVIPILGLSIRANASQLPTFIASYAPDVLWAFLVFALVGVVAPHQSTPRVGLIALAFAFTMECSQLYQAPWINDLRATRIGGLLLGVGFLWSDLVCYTVGVGLGIGFDGMLRSMLQGRHEHSSEDHDSDCARHSLG